MAGREVSRISIRSRLLLPPKLRKPWEKMCPGGPTNWHLTLRHQCPGELARLVVQEHRGGRGPRAAQTVAGFKHRDGPVLLRTLLADEEI